MKHLPHVVAPFAIIAADMMADGLINSGTSLRIECPECGRVFATEDGLRRHAHNYHHQGVASPKRTEE